MANSLSDWLAGKVSSCIASHANGIRPDQEDQQSLLGDIAYEKGLGVQILHFFTPQVARQAFQELCQSFNDGLVTPQRAQRYDPVREAAGGSTCNDEDVAGPLCATVADKAHRVHVQFSRHCVARFNSTHSRPLISLRGSIIHIKSFRPSISFLPFLLDSEQRRDEPFGASLPAVKPTLILEVESMQVLGAINEIQFWEVKELEPTLLNELTPPTPFKSWYKQVKKVMMRDQKRRRRLREEQEAKNDSDARKIAKSSSESNSTSAPASSASVPMPPPFQRPREIKARHPEAMQSSGSTISSNGAQVKAQDSWGDFTLTQGDDEYGLEAAASQLIERHEQGLGSTFEGHLTADSLDTHAIFPSLQIEEIPLESSGDLHDDASRSAPHDVGSLHSSGKGSSQHSTVPATFPLNSSLQEEVHCVTDVKPQSQDHIGPPSVTETTSLPFSLGASIGKASIEEANKLAGGEDHAKHNIDEEKRSTFNPLISEYSRIKPRGSTKDVGVGVDKKEAGTGPMPSFVKREDTSPFARFDYKTCRIPTPEVIKERDSKQDIEMEAFID